MKKFELFMCCLGNGLTVCNKAIEKNGEYQHIAHISNAGNIKWHIPVSSVPGPDLLRIEHTADVMYENFKQAMERDLSADRTRAYSRMLDALPYSAYMQFIHDTDGWSDEKKVEHLKTLYLAYS